MIDFINMLQSAEPLTAVKLLIILLFSMISAPTAVHALARAVVHLAHGRRYGLGREAGPDRDSAAATGDREGGAMIDFINMSQSAEPLTAVKLLIILLFSMISAPTAVPVALARAVVHRAHGRRCGLGREAGPDRDSAAATGDREGGQ